MKTQKQNDQHGGVLRVSTLSLFFAALVLLGSTLHAVRSSTEESTAKQQSKSIVANPAAQTNPSQVGGGPPAGTICTAYAIATGTNPIVPGATDIGNHTDDGDTPVTLPFSFQLYDQTFTTVNVSSNGRLDFVTVNEPGGFDTSCLPAPANLGPFDYSIFAPWEDMRTDAQPGCASFPGGTCGVFTSVSGTAPNRIFNIEWRTVLFANTDATQNLEVRLYENDPDHKFEVIIGTLNTAGADHLYVSGVQGPSNTFTQDFCTSTPPTGVSRSYTCTIAPTPTPGPSPSPGAGCHLLIGSGMTLGYAPNGWNPTLATDTVNYAFANSGAAPNQFALFQTHDGWGFTILKDAITGTGHTFTEFTPAQLAGFNFSMYSVVILNWDDTFLTDFLTDYTAAIPALEAYINAGGVVWVQAAVQGTGETIPMPFGGLGNDGDFAASDPIVDPAHPMVAGMPNPIPGNSASHLSFTGLPAAAHVVVTSGNNQQPTLYEIRTCPTPTPTPTPPSPTPTPSPTPSITPTPTPGSPTPTSTPTPGGGPAQALNLSTRMLVRVADEAGIGGFIITGNTPKQVLVRGIGPSLGQFGVPNPLADPIMELHGPTGFPTVNNDNWRDTQEQEILATGLAPTNDLESAILATLDPGNYTAVVRGKNDTTGTGLVEVYDLGQANGKLGNISTRAYVSTAADIMIAGFILGGSTGDDALILRGIGPSLAAFGVPNVLADPTLELRDNNGAVIIANDNWMDDPVQAAIIQAAGLAPTNNLESAIAATLAPGTYTALLAGKNNGVGNGLVEVYDLASSGPIPTPSASPTTTPGGATPTPSPSPSPIGNCVENWDSVTAPALPAGWTATNPDPGDGTMWETSVTSPESAPNDAFIGDQDGISDKVLTRANVTVGASAVMSFRNNFNTEFSDGIYWDGYVLEVSSPNISGGEFLDITDSHVGGSIVSGGYTGEISGKANNPLAGRMAWSADSGGYIDTVINLGPNLAGQTIQMRFRMGTDEAVAAPGVRVDNISITNTSCP